MIQQWIKKTVDGQLVWDKKIVGAASANNIVVTNPGITNTPATLNSVLGAMKYQIDELYGNVKWLALHGGGGAGGAGGGGSASGDPYIVITGKKDGVTKEITNGSVQVNTTEYTFTVSLYNADADSDYYVTVIDEEEGTTYVNRQRLTKTSNSFNVTITGITEGKTVPLTLSIINDEGYRSRGGSLTITYAAVHISANLEISPGNLALITNNGQASKELDNNGFVLLAYFSPTVAGTVEYSISTTIRKPNGEYLSLSGRYENVASGGSVSYRVNLQAESGSMMTVGRPYSVVVTASVKSVIDGQEVTRATGKMTFQAVLNNPNSIYITYVDPNWQYIDNPYTDSYFQNGNNATLSTTIIAPTEGNYYRDIYYVAKFYYGTPDEEGNDIWHPLANSAISYGYLKDNDDTTPDFVTDGLPTERNQYRQWITNNNSALLAWQNANASRSVTINTSDGVSRSITIPYNVIESSMFRFSKEDTEGKFAHIRADFFIINIGSNAGTDQIILPFEYNSQNEIVEAPFLSLKTEVMQSAQSIPSYVTGLQSGSKDEESNEYTYWQDNMRVFNLDTIAEPTTESVNNDADDPVFSFSQEFGESYSGNAPRVTIPMHLYNINGANSGIVEVSRKTYVASKPLKKSNGETVTNTYNALRFSGKSYGQIKPLDFYKFFNSTATSIGENSIKNGWKSSSTKSGYTIELVFNSDWHPSSDGTIFSMCDYDSDNNMTMGIEVTLEQASFRIGNESSTEIAQVTLTQNTFTQLDFVFETTKESGTLTGIAKIYVNGICTGITSLTIPETSTGIKFEGPSLPNGITLGCKSNFTDFTDVDIYGFRIYKQKLSDYEVLKNWLVSYATGNKGEDGGVDWDNIINPALKRNYFDDDWASVLWDYTAGTDSNGNYIGHKAASGESLFEAMKKWISKEVTDPVTGEVKTEMYRPMPVILLSPSGTNDNFGKSSDLFYATYNEATAAVNNGYISSGEKTGTFTSCFEGKFEYYDTNYETVITAPHNVAWYMQGTSTQAYRSKNIELCFELDDVASGDLDKRNNSHILFTPDPKNWLPENRFTLKADVMDSAHANNAAIGRWINRSSFMPLNPAQQDDTNIYRDKIKSTLEGFPVLVFVDWGHGISQNISGYQFLGIYSFNLGRGSYFNLGFKKITKYELAEGASNATDDDVNGWTDVSKVEHASFVKRYKMPEVQNTNIFSFECTTNTPSQAAGLQQPNIDLMKKVWDLKWTSNGNTDLGYNRLKTLVRTLGYCDGDTLGGKSHVPEYYYGLNGADIGPLEVWRNPTTGGISLTEQSGYVKDNCKWYEGLQLLEGVTGMTFDTEGNYVSGRKPDLQPLGKLAVNFTVNDGDSTYTPTIDRAPLMDQHPETILHYGSFSRYFVIAILFGMIDSLGKNLTLRSWNLTDGNNGTFVPAFYDMDTALGLDNAGLEKVDPTAYVDYWINSNTNTNSATGVQLKVFTESYPYTDRNISWNEHGEQVYTWYDKNPSEGGKVIATYGINDPQPPIPDNVIFDIIDSHLWHLIRFMPEIAAGLNSYDSDVVMAWAPIGQYAILRGKFLSDINDFVDNYFLGHNEDVGEFIFNLDYKEKYQTPYVKVDSATKEMTYDDMKFCHGRRDNYVRAWMKKRINFLDSIFNLGRMYKPSTSDNTGEVPEFEWAAQGNVNYFNADDTDVIALGTTRGSDGDWVSNYMHELSTKSEASKVGNYQFNITSNSTVVLIISISNKQYRYLLRDGVPEFIRMSKNDGQYSININNVECISEWENLKDLRFTQFNQKWNLLSLDLSGQDSVESGSSSDFSLSSALELRTLDLSNFHTRSMSTIERVDFSMLKKLQVLRLDNSDIAGITLPEGGNLQTLSLSNCSKMNGVLSIRNMTSLEGVISIAGCPNITGIEIENCPKLEGIAFGQNVSLASISIHNCPSMTSFSYSGTNDTRDGENTFPGVMKSISITGNCKSLASINVDHVTDQTLVLDFSGATGLKSLSLASITSTYMPILPQYYDDKGDKSSAEIYNSDEGFSLSMTGVNFPAFLCGKGRNALVAYKGHASEPGVYPEIFSIDYDEYISGKGTSGTTYVIDHVAPEGGIILNLAVFNKVEMVFLQDCQYVEYIAYKFDESNPVSNMSLQRVNNLKRVFGYIGFGPETFDRGLSSFYIGEWNSTTKADLQIKSLFESAVNSKSDSEYNEYKAQIEELMFDIDPSIENPVQGIVPATRLFINPDTVSFNRTFRSTALSTNDLYYIMMLINWYNKENKCVNILDSTFNSCININTSCTKDADTGEIKDSSPSRYLFKHMHTVTSVKNMFSGASNMTGVLYSPDYNRYASISSNKDFETFIGTVTPFSQNCTNIGNIGWSLKLYDDYAFWTPPAEDMVPLYYDKSKYYKGCFEAIVNTEGLYNNVTKIACAIDGYLDIEETYFTASLLAVPFKNAEVFKDSFNNIYVTFDNKFYKGVTYNEMLKWNTKVKKFENSFNFTIEEGSIVIDLFGGAKVLRNDFPNNFPGKVESILGSFGMSIKYTFVESTGDITYDGTGYFVLTDDMFQRCKSTLKEIAPYVDPTATVDINNGMFASSNVVVKTYAKYASDNNTEPGAKFPYGIFAGCTELTYAPAFFAGLNLMKFVDMTAEYKELTATAFEDEFEYPDRSSSGPLNVPIPNYYDSLPYVEKVSMDGTVEHTAKLRLFKDNTKLVNLSNIFRNMTPPFENVNGSIIPGGFILTQDGFAGLTALENLSYAFANNHYFRGSVPFRLLWTADTTTKKTCEGTNDITAAKYGLAGMNIDGTSFAGDYSLSSIKNKIDNQGSLNLGSTYKGILAEARVPYGGYYYVPDDYATTNVYVISYADENAYKYNQFNTVTGEGGRVYPAFVAYNDSNTFHKKLKRYRRENTYEWYQKLNAVEETVPTSSVEVTMPVRQRNIKNIEKMFKNNDAAGYLYLRYTDNSLSMHVDTYSYNASNYAKSQQYKWNAYDKTEYMTANGKYDNKSLFRENPNYNPWTFVPNANLDRNLRKQILWADLTDEAKVWRYVWRNTIAGFPDPTQQETATVKAALANVLSGSSSDADIASWISAAFSAAVAANTSIYDYPQLKGVPCYIPNYEYDPRVVIINEELGQVTFNDLVYDGESVSGYIDNIVKDSSSYILDGVIGGSAYPSTVTNAVKEAFVKRHIPKQWTNPRVAVTDPYISTGIDSNETDGLGISYQNDSYTFYQNGNSSSISTFELEFINNMKAEKKYFVPSDVLSYVHKSGNVKYAFSETTYQGAKINDNIFFQNMVIGKLSNPGNVFYETMYDVSTYMRYYPEGNHYTGIPGKVSPMMFNDASTFTSIEGLFYKNPQIYPYTWSGKVNGVTIMGDLFDIDTFKPLENMTDTYMLWANNVVPRNVRIAPDTFKNNKKVYYGDYMFAGTIWYGYSSDDTNVGTQIQEGMFDSQNLIVANSMFTSILNFSTPTYATGADINPQLLISSSPNSYGDGEIGNAGNHGLRTCPTNLFDNSRDSLRQASNLFYFDQSLKNFPAIYWYKYFSPLSQDSNFGTTIWSKRLFHAAYFLNSGSMNADDINNLGAGGPWQLQKVDPSIESTLTGSKRNYVSYFANGWDSKVNNSTI